MTESGSGHTKPGLWAGFVEGEASGDGIARAPLTRNCCTRIGRTPIVTPMPVIVKSVMVLTYCLTRISVSPLNPLPCNEPRRVPADWVAVKLSGCTIALLRVIDRDG